MTSRRFQLTVALGMTILAYPCVFGAIVEQSVDELTRNSDVIARGQVTAMTSQWDSSHSYIYTTAEVAFSTVYAGGPIDAPRVTIWIPGGSVGDTTLWVEHAAEFTVGQDVVLFLTDRSGVFDVTSWEQGKLNVVDGRIEGKNTTLATFEKTLREVINQVKKAGGQK